MQTSLTTSTEHSDNTVFDYNSSDYPTDYDNFCDKEELNVFNKAVTPVVYCLIAILGLFGNTLVLWILLKYENVQSVTSVFILNLAISDLFSCLLLPFWIVYHLRGWIFGDFACKIIGSGFFVAYYSGIFFLSLMSIYRCYAIICPVSTIKEKNWVYCVLLCVVTWVISFLAVLPQAVFHKVYTAHDFMHCDFREEQEPFFWTCFAYYFQNALFFTSFSIILYCYTKILKTLCRCKMRQRPRTVKLILNIVVVFFVTWAPYNVMIFIKALELQHLIISTCESEKQFDYFFIISRSIALSHNCMNPVFYALVGEKFRMHLFNMLCRFLKCLGSKQSTLSKMNKRISYYSDDPSFF
ncbi:chemokine XC receptor 1-like [Protopterus annectens]|uniref:chemokine XC receptor 1-like n=1 Tax=Protopterus annectens TaxID=7888 RepID=UPI001CF95455|nr:chemokine XC receptor 1-like [Protopterus annectens]